MARPGRFLKYWAPVLGWMGLIFSASGDAGSSCRSSRILGPLFRWLFPEASEATIDLAVSLARKTAHLLEYAVLALLVWRAVRQPAPGDGRPWRWWEAGLAWAVAVAYAASDELHQCFVPGREGHVRDVLLDATGAALGLLALRAWGRWRKRW